MHLNPEPGSKALSICFVILVSLLCFDRISAATLADYRHRVSESIVIIKQLQADINEGPSSRVQPVTSNVTRIRELLPAKETVLIEDQSVMVDNAWLHDELQDYEKANSTGARRAETLMRIEERLRSLDEGLQEMRRPESVHAGDKDGNKGKLAEILRRPEYNKAVAEGSALDRWLSRLIRWILSLLPKSKPIAPSNSLLVARLVQVIVVVVSLGAIAFLIWKLAPRYLHNLRRKKKQGREARIVLGERLEPDQTSADLLAQAEALARKGDLRGAIRKAYIALLCELGDRKIVSLAQHKTNRDYLNSVRERVQLYSSMRQLTNSFELHWYGIQPPAENDWREFRKGYQRALRVGL